MFRLLLPASSLYGLLTDIRNSLFDKGLRKSYRPGVCTVSVGNLTVGGTGKTPVVEYLIKRYVSEPAWPAGTVATLSRGYGRQTTGFRVATDQDTAATLGDEPLQLYRKFGRYVRVCVGERRAEAIRQIQHDFPETKLILLDDAFQHRAVRPHINLLLTDYNRLFYRDVPFPAGRLRENRAGAKRADAVLVTKCPATLPTDEQTQIRETIGRYVRPDTPIFFAGLRYDQPQPFDTLRSTGPRSAERDPVEPGRARPGQNVVLVSGLANADPLEHYVQRTFSLQKHWRFADHYAYKRTDLDRLLADLQPHTSLLTTEKDWVKLDALLTDDERARWPLYYLPVAVQFLDGSGAAFDQFMADAIRKKC